MRGFMQSAGDIMRILYQTVYSVLTRKKITQADRAKVPKVTRGSTIDTHKQIALF